MLELVLILFTINTRIVIKEMFLNIMIMFIMYNIKWEKPNKLTLKIELNIFTTTLSISKILMQGCQKLTKNHTKTLAFTTLCISQRKKLMIVKIFTV